MTNIIIRNLSTLPASGTLAQHTPVEEHIMSGTFSRAIVLAAAIVALAAGSMPAQGKGKPTAAERAAVRDSERTRMAGVGKEIRDTAAFWRSDVRCTGKDHSDCVITDGRKRFFVHPGVVNKNGDIAVTTVVYGNDSRDDRPGLILKFRTMTEVYHKVDGKWIKLPYNGPVGGS
jgi:hypothetical protein